MDCDEFLEFGGASKVFFLDTNLSSPILTTELDATKQLFRDTIASNDFSYFFKLHDRQRTAVSFFRKLCRIRGFKKTDLLNMPQLQPQDYPLIEQEMLEVEPGYDSSYATAKLLCSDIEQALVSGLESRGLPGQEVLGTSDLFMAPEADKLRYAYETFSNLFGRAESRVKENEYVWTKGRIGNVHVSLNAHTAIINIGPRHWYSSLNQVLMLKDKIATRYMLIEHVRPLGLDDVLIDHLLKLFDWQDRTLGIYGNQAYNILKTVEPLFKTRLSHIVDNIFGDDTAYTRMIQKTNDKEEKIRKTTGVTGKKSNGRVTRYR